VENKNSRKKVSKHQSGKLYVIVMQVLFSILCFLIFLNCYYRTWQIKWALREQTSAMSFFVVFARWQHLIWRKFGLSGDGKKFSNLILDPYRPSLPKMSAACNFV